MMVKSLSASKIGTFEQCPLKFRYAYVEKREPLETSADYFILGRLVHKALEKLADNPTWDYVESAVYESIDEIGEIPKPEQINQALDMLKGWFSPEKFKDKVLSKEEFFTVDIGGVAVNGIVDRIDEIEGGIRIVDYKTGSQVYTSKDLEGSVQLLIYAYFGFQRYGAEKVEIVYDMIKHNHQVSMVVTREQMEWIEKYVRGVYDAIRKSEGEPRINEFCAWCEYRHICPKLKEYLSQSLEIPPVLEEEDIFKLIRTLEELSAVRKTLEEKEKRIKDWIVATMVGEGVEDLPAGEYHLALSYRRREEFPPDTVVELVPEKYWKEVLSVRNGNLKKILPQLPITVREKIEASKKTNLSSPYLVIRRKP